MSDAPPDALDVNGTEAEADEPEADEDEGSIAEDEGSIAEDVLDYLARQIVDDPDGVVVEVDERPGRVDLRLNVAPGDMGKVIGRRGRVAQSIRTVVRAAGACDGVEASVDIVD